MRDTLKAWLRSLLEIDKQDERIQEIARHFVTRRDPQTGEALETLADKNAIEDGKPAPGVIRKHGSGNWNRQRRFMEAQSSGIRKD